MKKKHTIALVSGIIVGIILIVGLVIFGSLTEGITIGHEKYSDSFKGNIPKAITNDTTGEIIEDSRTALRELH